MSDQSVDERTPVAIFLGAFWRRGGHARRGTGGASRHAPWKRDRTQRGAPGDERGKQRNAEWCHSWVRVVGLR